MLQGQLWTDSIGTPSGQKNRTNALLFDKRGFENSGELESWPARTAGRHGLDSSGGDCHGRRVLIPRFCAERTSLRSATMEGPKQTSKTLAASHHQPGPTSWTETNESFNLITMPLTG